MITMIGFDADDTLWQNEQFFKFTQGKFSALLGAYAEADYIAQRLLEAEKENLAFYGFGIKGFTLSMIETAIAVTNGKVETSVIAEILAAGREMLHHPVELLPQVGDTLERLAGDHRLVLITKGDLFDQERKLAQSGLGDFFDGVEIVSAKTADTYTRIFKTYGDDPAQSMMIGNSLKSDVVPSIQAGGYGIYVPHDLTWSFEYEEAPRKHFRFREIPHLGLLPNLISTLE